MPSSNFRAVKFCSGTFLAVVFLMALLPSSAPAQTLYGTVVGSVKDPSGAVVPGAKVTITDKGTNQSRDVTTDAAGSYTLTAVPTGSYTITVTKQGFKTLERTGVSVKLNTVERVDVELEVGSESQSVTVTGEAAVLQTDTSEVHADVQSHELENLPIPLGRNYQQIYRSLPGFTPPVNSHSIPTNPARSLEFNVNGTSDNQNNTRIDGVSTYNIQLPHVTSYVPTLESIQEVNVVTNSFDAEQGLAGGAAINVETKSGTNQFHGSLFEYHSDNHIKAWPDQFENASANAGNKPKLVYNQFGGSAGGPIKKDKIFFFASYEGSYDHRGVQRFVTVPNPAMKQGDFSGALDAAGSCDQLTAGSDGACVDSPYPLVGPNTYDTSTFLPPDQRQPFVVTAGDPNFALCNLATNPGCINIIPSSLLQDPSSLITQKLIALIPDPNVPGAGATSNYFASGPFSFDRKQLDTKFDFAASRKLNFVGTFGVLHYNDITPTVFGNALVGRPIGGSSNSGHGSGNTYRMTIMGTYTLSPNVVLDAHFGWARQGTSSEPPGLGTNVGSDVLGIPGTNGSRAFESGWPEFDIAGFATLGIDNNFMPYYRHDPQFQYVANINWIKGAHNIRFGGDFYRMALNQTQAEFLGDAYGAQGGFNFGRGPTERCLDATCGDSFNSSRSNSFAAFMLGLPDTRSRTLEVQDVNHVRAHLMSFYGRDRWNVTPKLTLDYGLRWEFYPVPTRPDRGIELYDVDTGKVLVCGIQSVPKDCGIKISKKLFAPRFGFAYRASNTLVFRAGYGITIDPYMALEPLRANYPILVALTQTGPTSFDAVGKLVSGIPAVQAPSFGNGIIDIPSDVAFNALPKNIHRGYVQSWNITIQKELGGGFTAQAGYVATRQTRESAYLDLNAGQVPGAGQAGQMFNGFDPSRNYGRTASTIFPLTAIGTGHYDSLQTSLQRRFASGLSLTVNYTWSKGFGPVTNSDCNPGDCFQGGTVQALRYLHINRAVQDFDHTHNLEITNIWDLPLGRGKHWLSGSGRAVSGVVSGWQVNSLVSMISGAPFTVYADDTSLNMPGNSQFADQLVAHPKKLGGIGIGNPFYDPSNFAEVSQARFGTAGFNSLRAPGFFNWDFGLFRSFDITERWKLQFRAEAFNFTNHPHYSLPDGGGPVNISDGPDALSINSVTDVAREGVDERQFRVGLRLSF